MYLLYADESGDNGMGPNSPSQFYALSGIVVHELRWLEYLDDLIDFRRRMRVKHGLKMREEVHAGPMISHPGALARIPKYDRLAILRSYADQLASMPDLNIINILINKAGKPADYDVFDNAWSALLQRFQNTIANHNFPGPRNPQERGTIFPDHTINVKLQALLRKKRRYNPVPNSPRFGSGFRDLKLVYVLEDPNFRDSRDSYYIQGADVAAFFLYQFAKPNKYMRAKGASKYIDRLDPILCKVAALNDPRGIVRL